MIQSLVASEKQAESRPAGASSRETEGKVITLATQLNSPGKKDPP